MSHERQVSTRHPLLVASIEVTVVQLDKSLVTLIEVPHLVADLRLIVPRLTVGSVRSPLKQLGLRDQFALLVELRLSRLRNHGNHIWLSLKLVVISFVPAENTLELQILEVLRQHVHVCAVVAVEGSLTLEALPRGSRAQAAVACELASVLQ